MLPSKYVILVSKIPNMSARKMPLGVNELAAKNNSMSLIEFQTYIAEGDERLQKVSLTMHMHDGMTLSHT